MPPVLEPSAAQEPSFTGEQKEYLAGYFAGLASRPAPFVGLDARGLLGHAPGAGAVNLAAEPVAEETWRGFALSEITKEEGFKRELNPLDIWERLIAHSSADKFPEGGDVFRFKYHGLFYVAPAQDSLMLRLRVPAGELTATQLRGLSELARRCGAGHADITTRANLQIREIRPRHILDVLTRLSDLGLTSRGAGADNVRNITASPTAGVDRDELIDVRPLAKALHFYILNQRDLYGLPRKFNVAFDGGGAVSVVADTNDIAFTAVEVAAGSAECEPGIHFRVALAGITGHKQFAQDAGLLIKPEECVAVAAAMVRVFDEHGDRTDRKKARLKYLLDQKGMPWFLAETAKKLTFPLRRAEGIACRARRPSLRHGHIGVYRQRQPGLNYIGASVPAGRMTSKQMRRLADWAEKYNDGQLRLTVWQNVIFPDVLDADVDKARRELASIGTPAEASSVAGGLVACTGNAGCRFAATATKAHLLELQRHLDARVQLDFPVNIHLTGCPHSCAQHYIGDIGLLGTKVTENGVTSEAYHVLLGGGSDHEQGLGREVFRAIPFSQVPALLSGMLSAYLEKRRAGEDFRSFSRRHEIRELQEIFS